MFLLDPSKKGLRKIFSEYQASSLKYVWRRGRRGANSREVWNHVRRTLGEGESISRASVINFLNSMVEKGVLDYREATGKGGYHKVYFPRKTEGEFRRQVVKAVLESFLRDYPEETMISVTELFSYSPE